MERIKRISASIPLEPTDMTENAINEIILQTFPKWDAKNLKLELMAAGFMNKVYKVIHEDEKVMVRIFTPITDKLITNVNMATLGMMAAHREGIGAKVHAVFSNGVLYDYLPGEMLNPDVEKYNDPQIHRLTFEGLEINGVCMQQEKAMAYKEVYHFINRIPDDFDGSLMYKSNKVPCLANKETLLKEVDWCLSEVKALDVPLYFTHGDLWWSNTLYDEEKDRINIIDFDLCGFALVIIKRFNPYAVDLARFIVNALFYVSEPAHYKPIPEDEQKSLCRIFLEESRKLDENSNPVTEKDVKQMFSILRAFKMFVFLHIMIFLVTASYYREIKGIMIALDACYRELKKEYLEHKTKFPNDFVSGWQPW